MLDLPGDETTIDFDWMHYAPVDLSRGRRLPNRVFGAQLAALVYERDECEGVLAIMGYTEYVFHDRKKTQAITAVHAESRHAIVVFEGTTERADWWRNFKFARKKMVLLDRIVKMHCGFDEAGRQLDKQLGEYLDEWNARGLTVYVFGHSQGAALALRLALMNPTCVHGVYAVAIPRMGNGALVEAVREAPFYTVAIGSFFDAVTFSPPWPYYQQQRNLILLDPTRWQVKEVHGLRESWAVIIRWFYLSWYTARLAGMLLTPATWWMMPKWWRGVRRLWRDHGAARHYAVQTQKLIYAAIERGDYSHERDKPPLAAPGTPSPRPTRN